MTEDVAVIFDTNAYRGLTRISPVNTVVASERAKKITSYASPYVVMELASHLVDEGDPHYAECRLALALLYQHCRAEPGGNLRSLPYTEDHLACLLYDREIPTLRAQAERLGPLAWQVATASPGSLPPQVQEECHRIARHMEITESFFGLDMIDVVLGMNPAATDWNPFAGDKRGRTLELATIRDPAFLPYLGVVVALRTRILLGTEKEQANLADQGKFVLDHFGVGLRLYQGLLKKIIETGANMEKKENLNTVWDMEIVLGIGDTIAGQEVQEVHLVTDERAISSAATNADLEGKVIRLADYLSSL